MTPIEFVQHIASFRTFEEYVRNNYWPEDMPTEEELLEEIAAGPDTEWIENDAEDLTKLVLMAREVLKANPTE
jgi:hypothetical protein